MLDIEKLTQITGQVVKDLPANLLPFKGEIEKHLKTTLQNIFAKLDLVTRQEFDAQIKVLLRTREKLEALENKMKELEETK
jgi:BMFP domain-containing protein YqiC